MLLSDAVPAVWHDGKSAVARPVLVCKDPTGHSLCIYPADGTVRSGALTCWEINSIGNLTAKLPKDVRKPFYLHRKPDTGERLALQEQYSKESVLRWTAGHRQAARSRLRRRWTLAGAGAWLVLLLFYLGTPVFFSILAHYIPQRWEEKLGLAARDNVITALSAITGARVKEEAGNSRPLAMLMERLEQAAPVEGYRFDVTVLEVDFVNAFALPGGYLVVSSALVEQCESPDELAGVLAHEMTHVMRRHSTAGMLRRQVWMWLLQHMGAGGGAGDLAAALLTSSFSRDDEREADALGAERLILAGINPLGLVRFFQHLEKEEQEETMGRFSVLLEYVASHPGLAERQKAILRLLETHGYRQEEQEGQNGQADPEKQQHRFTPALPHQEWQELRRLCGVGETEQKRDPEKVGGQPDALHPEEPASVAPAGQPADGEESMDSPAKAAPEKETQERQDCTPDRTPAPWTYPVDDTLARLPRPHRGQSGIPAYDPLP